jgi:hypothetical protein
VRTVTSWPDWSQPQASGDFVDFYDFSDSHNDLSQYFDIFYIQ